MELSYLPHTISFSSSSSFFLSFYLSIRYDSLRIRQVTQSSFDYIYIDCGSKNISGVVRVTRIQFIYIWFRGIEKHGSKSLDRNASWRQCSAALLSLLFSWPSSNDFRSMNFTNHKRYFKFSNQPHEESSAASWKFQCPLWTEVSSLVMHISIRKFFWY